MKNKILYVDDEESNLRIFKDTFRRNFDVFTATSGKEGLKILENHKIDLILSDQRMPEMSGIEFLKHTFDMYPNTNRILVTGFSDFDAVENAINKARVFQYIQKPWEKEALLNTIADALRLQHLELENKRQKEELTIAWKRAEESDQLKTEFLNNISHEIRTPVNGIYGFSELLKNTRITEENKNKYVEIIKDCSLQLIHTVDSILEFSQLITKQQPPDYKNVDVNYIFDELYSLFQRTNTNKDIKFSIQKELDNEESNVLSDKKQLINILTKLLDNAFKFTEKGEVRLKSFKKDNKLVFSIEDTGIGIKEDDQKIIFNSFAKNSKINPKKDRGLGLGLAIAIESSKLINASIWFESEKNKGTTFFVSIPAKKSVTEQYKVNDISRQIEKSSINNLYKILIAEDEEINYKYLEIIVKQIFKNKVNIIWAQNGKSAVEQCEKNADIDLILMDIKMPLLNGYEATKSIKEIYPNIPIIAQTAYTSDDDKQRALEAGCNNILSKPLMRDELEAMLSQYLNFDPTEKQSKNQFIENSLI